MVNQHFDRIKRLDCTLTVQVLIVAGNQPFIEAAVDVLCWFFAFLSRLSTKAVLRALIAGAVLWSNRAWKLTYR